MWETWIQSLSQEDPLEKEMATHSSILAWKNPMDGGAWQLLSMRSQRVRHNWLISLSFFHNILVHRPHCRYCLACDNNSNKKSLGKKIPIALICWFSSCYSMAKSCPTLCDPTDCSTPGSPVIHNLPELAWIHGHWVSDAIQPFHHHLPSLLLSSIFPSVRVFSNESALHIRWPKYWSFIFSISPCNEYSGLISFNIDLFDLLAIQGTLKSLLQHWSSKA